MISSGTHVLLYSQGHKNFKHSAISVSAHSNRMQKLSSILLALTPAHKRQGVKDWNCSRSAESQVLWLRCDGGEGGGAQDEGKSKPKRKRIALK